MNKPKDVKIMVIRENTHESWLIDCGTFLMCFAVMVVSRFMDSQAMGWLGFIMLCTIALARFATKTKHFFTIAEARAELDRIEKQS